MGTVGSLHLIFGHTFSGCMHCVSLHAPQITPGFTPLQESVLHLSTCTLFPLSPSWVYCVSHAVPLHLGSVARPSHTLLLPQSDVPAVTSWDHPPALSHRTPLHWEVPHMISRTLHSLLLTRLHTPPPRSLSSHCWTHCYCTPLRHHCCSPCTEDLCSSTTFCTASPLLHLFLRFGLHTTLQFTLGSLSPFAFFTPPRDRTVGPGSLHRSRCFLVCTCLGPCCLRATVLPAVLDSCLSACTALHLCTTRSWVAHDFTAHFHHALCDFCTVLHGYLVVTGCTSPHCRTTLVGCRTSALCVLLEVTCTVSFGPHSPRSRIPHCTRSTTRSVVVLLRIDLPHCRLHTFYRFSLHTRMILPVGFTLLHTAPPHIVLPRYPHVCTYTTHLRSVDHTSLRTPFIHCVGREDLPFTIPRSTTD